LIENIKNEGWIVGVMRIDAIGRTLVAEHREALKRGI
jgi:hypothetical protein